MPALPTSQPSDWNNNVYVLATTRIFIMIGLAYLIKSLCNVVPSIWGTRSASIAAVVPDGIGLEDIISNTPVTVPSAGGTGPDLEASITLETRPPQPSYDQQSQAERSLANARAQGQGMEVPDSPTGAHAVAEAEQNVGVRRGDPETEEEMDISVAPTG